jgi:hypothetical protein
VAYTQADSDTLARAIATGVKVVRYSDGRSVEYASLADLLAAKRIVDEGLAALAGTTVSRMVLVGTSRGIT